MPDNTLKTQRFLDTLLKGVAELALYFVIWTREATYTYKPDEVAAIVDTAQELAPERDVYFSLGLQTTRPQGRARGEVRTVGAIPGLWLDIDFAGGAHAASKDKLPSPDQALAFANDFPLAPSIIVQSGGGFHVYWLFKEPWALECEEERLRAQALSRRFQRTMQKRAELQGFKIDNTSALNQVLRIPGTLNHKYDPPRTVEVLEEHADRRYNPDEFHAFLVDEDALVTVEAGTHVTKGDFPPTKLELIEEHCAFMAHCRDHAATLTEPEWFAQASIISKCENDEELFHERSKYYPKYDYADARRKLQNASSYGPRTCESIIQDLGQDLICEPCPFRGRIKSPVQLGSTAPAAQAKLAVVKALKGIEADPSAAFAESFLTSLAHVACTEKPSGLRFRELLKGLGVPVKKLDEAIKPYIREARQGGEGFSYIIHNGCLTYMKPTNYGFTEVQLSNFSAEIVEEVTRDDGVERTKHLRIKGRLATGDALPSVDVTAKEFPSLNWVIERWGTQAVVFPNARGYIPAAIQLLSKDVRHREIFAHTGWRYINEEWMYLSATGALGASGLHDDVEVDADFGQIKDFMLEAASNAEELQEAITASSWMLHLARPDVTYPLLAATFRAVIAEVLPVDYSLFISGYTGGRKSAVAAIVQAHFGRGFHGKHLPANWTSTENSLEKQAFLAKDSVLVVDDFLPAGGGYDSSAYYKKAERVLRGQGNQAGRQRMFRDGALRATYHPRGLIVSTGEDIPRGQSLRARMLTLEIGKDEVNLEALTSIQAAGESGLLAKSLGGFIQWIAPQVDQLKEILPATKASYRCAAQGADAHSRTPDIVADLMIGLDLFLDFALYAGVIDEQFRVAHRNQGWEALLLAGKRQKGLVQDEDPVERYLELLNTALAAGWGHLQGMDGKTPSAPQSFGWGKATTASGTEWRPLGKLIGWTDGVESLYVMQEAAYGVVSNLATSQSSPLGMSSKALAKHLKEQGHLASTSSDGCTIRKIICGQKRRLLHLKCDSVIQIADEQDNLIDPDSPLLKMLQDNTDT